MNDQVKIFDNKRYLSVEQAKEREEKLIRAAYHFPTSLENAEDLDSATKLLLKKAKLEELK